MIRRAESKDAKRIHELLQSIRELHQAMYPDRFKGEAKYGVEEILDILADPKTLVFVYALEEVLGYVIAFIKEDHLFVDDLCVDESMRGQKIGEQLMDQILLEAKALGKREIQLNVWEKNKTAIHFYEKLGYAPLKYTFSQSVDLN